MTARDMKAVCEGIGRRRPHPGRHDHRRTAHGRPLSAHQSGSKRDFSNWFKDRIKGFKLVEDQDYSIDSPNSANQTGRGGDRRSKEYWLTSEAAQWLAADGKSERGVEVIKYLVARNKRLAELEKVGQPAVIDFSDPVAVCKLYLEAEEGRRRVLALVKTVTAEKVQAVCSWR